MYKHILLPTDGSELAMKGLEQGLALAKALKASATIATVTPEWSAYEMAIEAQAGRSNPIERFEKETATTAQRILNAAKRKAEAAGVDVDTVHMAERHAAEGIIEAATERGCDLIVMSSHGRRGVRRIVLGSQAAEVVTNTTIPVLIIR